MTMSCREATAERVNAQGRESTSRMNCYTASNLDRG
jgi:hypothetical protein